MPRSRQKTPIAHVDRAATSARPWRYFTVAASMPTLGSALGLDGGALFQIAAVEDLGLAPSTIGFAFLLGLLSLPVQVAAARFPLWQARRNLRLFLFITALQCFAMAALVVFNVIDTNVAFLALGITILAEVNLSVLFATSWQPLLNFGLESEVRQGVNARGRAVGGLIVAGIVVLYGSSSMEFRSVIFALLGLVAIILVATCRDLPSPDRPDGRSVSAGNPKSRVKLPRSVYPVFGLLSLAGLTAGWPLFLVYCSEYLWPEVNLGAVGAVQVGGALLAASVWRAKTNLTRVAAQAGWILLLATTALVLLRAPIDGVFASATVVVALFLGSACNVVLLLALLERAHQAVDEETAVRTFTLLDVVASSTLQMGLFVSGLLVSASGATMSWVLDPYRIWLFVGAIAIAVAMSWHAWSRRSDDSPH